jgi:hypothetical protein
MRPVSFDNLDGRYDLHESMSGHQAQDDAPLDEFYDLWPRPILSPSFGSCYARNLSLLNASQSKSWMIVPNQSAAAEPTVLGLTNPNPTQQKLLVRQTGNVKPVDSQSISTTEDLCSKNPCLSRTLASSAFLPSLIASRENEIVSSVALARTYFNADLVSSLPGCDFSECESSSGIEPRASVAINRWLHKLPLTLRPSFNLQRKLPFYPPLS